MLDIDDENPQWKAVLNDFPNKVPRFSSKAEAEDFVRQQSGLQPISNPDYPNLMHSVTTLVDWPQIEKYLIPKMIEYRMKWPTTTFDQANSINQNENENSKCDTNKNPILDYLKSRMELPIHRTMSVKSSMNTLKYMFFHMRCGIYVMIRNNRVVIFCPFLNKDYTNTWGNDLKVESEDGSIEKYYEEKSLHYRPENYIQDKFKWWANGNIICNEYKSGKDNQWWGDHFLLQLKDMFSEACHNRSIPDCEFFINKRDYPHLKFNNDRNGGIPVEPYGFIYDKDDRDPNQDVPLTRHLYKSYTPILSFYSSDRFADIPIPPSEDWEAATGAVFPASFVHSYDTEGKIVVQPSRDLFTINNLKKFERPWDEKVPIAFFRGTATGGGVTVETNQRVHLAQVSYDWSLLPEYNGSIPSINNGHPFIDAKITGWNLRDKKISNSKMTFLHTKNFLFDGDKAKNFVEIYKQSTYKYLIYAEGHCAACRYGFMMQLGSVILKVTSKCVADSMWYFPLLQPYIDHIPIKQDLSDLEEKLLWCHSHDKECEIIANNAKLFYQKYISREGILDYIQSICMEISKRWCHVTEFSNNPPIEFPPPQLNSYQMASKNPYCCENENGNFLCSYCEEYQKTQAQNATRNAAEAQLLLKSAQDD
eukprot:gene14521-19494_t